MITELQHDIESQRRTDILDTRDAEVETLKTDYLEWFRENPQQFDNYLTEDDKLDIAYNMVLVDYSAADIRDYQRVLEDMREKVAARLAEAEVDEVVFTTKI